VNGNGLFRLRNGVFRHYTTDDGLPGMRVSSIVVDKPGTVLAATNEGVAELRSDPDHETDNQHFKKISDVPAISMCGDSQRGGLWLGTDDGLVFLKDGQTTRITQEQGLPGNMVLSVAADDAGNLWIATSNAIAQLDHQRLDAILSGSSKTIWPKRFTQADGLRSRDVLPIGQVSMRRAHDGRIWLATANGLSVADPASTPSPTVQVSIESITIDESLQPTTDPIEIPPGRHRLTVTFTAPDLHSPEQLRFRYRLQGWDKGWLDADSRQISYTGLPPGDYHLAIAAANEDGTWNEQSASMAVNIRPYFYQTKLFITLACLILLALVVEITRRRTRYVAEQQKLKFQERAAERERIAYQIHDTIIQDLVGTALQLELIGMQIPEHPENTASLLVALTARMRDMVAKSRNMVSSLHSTATPEYDLLEVLNEAAAEFRLGELPVLTLETRGTPRPIDPLIRDEVYRICREALANAFRHANANSIHVWAAFSDKEISIAIEDDGSGMDEQTRMIGRSGHFGLSGMQAHARRIGATVIVETEPGNGTTVRLTVPPASRTWWHSVRGRVVATERISPDSEY
jgi:signal transduction histidine kinase